MRVTQMMKTTVEFEKGKCGLECKWLYEYDSCPVCALYDGMLWDGLGWPPMRCERCIKEFGGV